MSDYIPDDVHSLISLSSSTIGSTRTDDFESVSESPWPDNIQDVDTNYDLTKLTKNKSEDDVFRRDSIPIEPTHDAFDRENMDEDPGQMDGRTGENPFLKSVKYLEQHAILRLFQNLATDIVYDRPDQPLQYIVDKLKSQQIKPKDDKQELENEEQKSEELPE